MDIASHVGAVTRTIRTGEREGAPTQTLVAERTYDTPIEDLWDALTSAERIPRWLMPISGELRLGGRYQLEGNAGGEITTCEPPRRLAVPWEYANSTAASRIPHICWRPPPRSMFCAVSRRARC